MIKLLLYSEYKLKQQLILLSGFLLPGIFVFSNSVNCEIMNSQERSFCEDNFYGLT